MLVVDKTGQAFLDDKAAGTGAGWRLTQTAKANPDTEVQLRADAAVPYGRVVEVMGAAQKAGLNRIGFVADGRNAQAPAPPHRQTPKIWRLRHLIAASDTPPCKKNTTISTSKKPPTPTGQPGTPTA
jgi:hypothetical protein